MYYLNEDAVEHQILECQAKQTQFSNALHWCPECKKFQKRLCPLAIARQDLVEDNIPEQPQ
jgi:hypothetical protein